MAFVLFICTANRYRSPIAAACFQAELLKQKGIQNWTILSAGTWTANGQPAISDAVRKARDFGLDIQTHRSRVITADLLKQADLTLVMEQGQKEALHIEFKFARPKIFMLTEVADGFAYDIPDPMNSSSKVDVVPGICEMIQKGLGRLHDLALENEAKFRTE